MGFVKKGNRYSEYKSMPGGNPHNRPVLIDHGRTIDQDATVIEDGIIADSMRYISRMTAGLATGSMSQDEVCELIFVSTTYLALSSYRYIGISVKKNKVSCLLPPFCRKLNYLIYAPLHPFVFQHKPTYWTLLIHFFQPGRWIFCLY